MLRPRRVVMLAPWPTCPQSERGWAWPGLEAKRRVGSRLSPVSTTRCCPRATANTASGCLLRGYFAPTNDRIQAFVQYAPPNRHIMYPDGSVQWCEVFLYATPESIRQSVGKVPEGLMTSVLEPPDRERCKFLEAFLSDVVQSGAKVEIFLPPLNPRIFEVASSEASDGARWRQGLSRRAICGDWRENGASGYEAPINPRIWACAKRTSWTSCICDGKQLNGLELERPRSRPAVNATTARPHRRKGSDFMSAPRDASRP